MVGVGAVSVVRDSGPDPVGGDKPVASDAYVPVHQSLIPGMVIRGPEIAPGVGVGEGVNRGGGEDQADVVRRGRTAGVAGIVNLGNKRSSLRGRQRNAHQPVGMGESHRRVVEQNAVNMQRIALQFILDRIQRPLRRYLRLHHACDVLALGVYREVYLILGDVKSGERIGTLNFLRARLQTPEGLGGAKAAGNQRQQQQGQILGNPVHLILRRVLTLSQSRDHIQPELGFCQSDIRC